MSEGFFGTHYWIEQGVILHAERPTGFGVWDGSDGDLEHKTFHSHVFQSLQNYTHLVLSGFGLCPDPPVVWG